MNVVGDTVDRDYFIVDFAHWLVDMTAWRQAIKNLFDYNLNQKFITIFDETSPTFEFRYKGGNINDQYNPRVETLSQFKDRINNAFNKIFLEVTIRNEGIPFGMKTRFQKDLKKYLGKVREYYGKDVSETPQKRKDNKHFQWLIDYQIPPYKTYSEIAEENKIKSVKSVKEAISELALLLGLKNLRQTKAGRPMGAKDKIKRSYRR